MRYVGLTLAIAVLLTACGACGGKLITADCGPSGHLCGLTEIQGLWCCPTSAECGPTSKTCIEKDTPDEPNGDGGSPNEASTPDASSSTGSAGCNGIGCGGSGTGGAQGPGSGQGRM